MSPYRDQRTMREWHAERWRRNRAEGIEILGSKCAECGSTRELQFDHVDPGTKVSSNIWTWARERRLAELAKCQLLCKKCHKKKSAADLRAHVDGLKVVDRWRPPTKTIGRYEVFS